MSFYQAVLFDWVGTLVHLQSGRWRLRMALERIGRDLDEESFELLVSDIVAAYRDPEVAAARAVEDCSIEQHGAAFMLWYHRAGLDDELAAATYAMESDPATHPPYRQSRQVLTQLKSAGVLTAVVTNFHMDIRPALGKYGFSGSVDSVVISAEHGFQKPDPRMFATALDALGVSADAALMVGDSALTDGAASTLGIDTLILPMPANPDIDDRGLGGILRLAGVDSSGEATGEQ